MRLAAAARRAASSAVLIGSGRRSCPGGPPQAGCGDAGECLLQLTFAPSRSREHAHTLNGPTTGFDREGASEGEDRGRVSSRSPVAARLRLGRNRGGGSAGRLRRGGSLV